MRNDVEAEERSGTAVVSSGFGKLHVTLAAREASNRGLLKLAITGAYPTPRVKRIISLLRLADKGRIARLMERDEGIPATDLSALYLPELLYEVAWLCRLPRLRSLYASLHIRLLGLYGHLAGRALRRVEGRAEVFHFASGYGQSSVARARQRGMVTLCDHAIVHPAMLDELIANRGSLRTRPESIQAPPSRLKDPHSRAMLADLAQADAALVNSHFVKETFVAAGWPPERVYVAYLGVDDNFIVELPIAARDVKRGPLRLIFAGRFEPRKGIDALVAALSDLRGVEWQLSIAGPIASEVRDSYRAFFEDARVIRLGTLLRPRLRAAMLAHEVLVFPSYAEGSARVVFEGLACGCYVITTPNSGSIVEDGVHGALVPPGDVRALVQAITEADSNRERLATIGAHNAEIVRRQFRQSHYGDALAAVYRRVAAQGQPARKPSR